MTASPLTVTVSYDGQVCVLAASGDLDFTTTVRFASCASRALDDGPERLVFDLAGLEFLDGAGARTLSWVAECVPEGCPVIVRSISSFAARVLEMLGLELERSPADAQPAADAPPVPDPPPGGGVPADPGVQAGPDPWPAGFGSQQPALDWAGVRAQGRVISLDHARTRRRMVRAAQEIAVTEERIAATFARMAAQLPSQADELNAVSRSARAYATQTRRWARSHQVPAS
jgi:anti-anti-sigma factor